MNYSFNRSISIHVIDIYDKPIKGAIVHLRNRHNILRADETTVSGYVYMDQVPGGVYTVTARYRGVTAESEVTVDDNMSGPIKVSIVIDPDDQCY